MTMPSRRTQLAKSDVRIIAGWDAPAPVAGSRGGRTGYAICGGISDKTGPGLITQPGERGQRATSSAPPDASTFVIRTAGSAPDALKASPPTSR